jgi:DNA-binding SARP family transcriptional activator
MVQKSMQPDLNIVMLGEFTLSSVQAEVSEQMNHSRKLWSILAFLLLNRDHPMNHEELTKALWEETKSKNPVNALKTQLYRVREMLQPITPPDQELIGTGKGHYYWNSELSIKIDVEEFEELIQLAFLRKTKREESVELLEKAVALYQGDFLPRIQLPWTDEKRSELREKLLNAALYLASYYESIGNHERIVSLCKQTLEYHPLNEDLNTFYIRGLLHLGQHQEALVYYEKVNDRYISEKGEYPGDALRNLYGDIMQLQQQIETDLSAIQQKLNMQDPGSGAFVCDYSFFREAYCLELRRAERSKQSIYIALITVTANKKVASTVDSDRLALVMKRLLVVLKENLRRGDVISQYSASQYVLLLPTSAYENSSAYENGILVLNRILSIYYKRNRRNDVILHCKLQPIKGKS